MSAKFLIAHSDTATMRALETVLREEHHNVRLTKEGLDAIDRALDDKPDAIILGTDLPGLNGLDVARALRALEPTRQIPILFIARDAREAEEISALRLPLVDTLMGPLDPAHVLEQSAKLLRPRAPSWMDLRPGDPDKYLAAISDPVTGLYDRHYLLHRLAYEAARSARYHTSLSCVLFGVDNYQELSERFGSEAADRVLVQIANIFRHAARVSDVIGRAGPHEFLAIAPHTDEVGANRYAARVRQLIREHDFELREKGTTITTSVGLSSASGTSLADNLALLGRAEGALMRARGEGADSVAMG